MLSTIQEKASTSIQNVTVRASVATPRVETNRARENRRYVLALAVSVSALITVIVLGISVL